MISVAYEAKLYLSLTAMVIGVVISIYYYFGWMRAIALPRPASFEDEEDAPDPWAGLSKPGFMKVVLVLLTVASIVLGFWQGPFGDVF